MNNLFEIKDIDRKTYEEELRDFLPEKMIDIHTHLWRKEDRSLDKDAYSRVVSWPSLVAEDNPIEDLMETYRLMFPDKEVTPMCFATWQSGDDLDRLNGYVSQVSRSHGIPALLYAKPEWSGIELENKIKAGGFLGIKIYLSLSPDYIPRPEIRIFDFLPRHQLEALNENGQIVMLHIPRDGRLGDPVNIAQMLEIERRYPNVRVIYAHVGRAYCNEDVGNAFERLKDTEHLVFDFSANTNADVFDQLIRCVGPKRILFGSDLPILRMRMRRICRDGHYVNLVPKGLYGDVSEDKNMGEVEGAEAEELTFFMYEELKSMKKAAEKNHLGRNDIEDIFFNNASSIIEAVRSGR